ncbi:MAG: hypothetical protein ACUVQY_05250 [Thermoproteota archaeon]
MVEEEVKKILCRIFLNKMKFEEVKVIMNIMLRERGILELEVFQRLVDDSLPSIPKVEISGINECTIKTIGECDLLVLLDQNKFVGLEVTLRSNLENKIEKLQKIYEKFGEIGLNFDFCIVTNDVENLSDVNVIELTRFSGEELRKRF